MDAFETVWNALGPVEGGYVNNPADPGGETNWGITLATARAAAYYGDMHSMTRDQAADIARVAFWKPVAGDSVAQLSTELAAELFDIDFNMGPHAGQWLQESLNALNQRGKMWPDLPVKGVIGAETLNAIRRLIGVRGAAGLTVLLRCVVALRCVQYIRDVESRPASEDFFFGWVDNRVLVDGPKLA